MGFSARHAFIDSQGQVQSITQKHYRALRDGWIANPDFASRRVQMASIYVQLKARRPVRILQEDYDVVAFGADGLLDLEVQQRQLSALAHRVERVCLGVAAHPPNVVDAAERFVLASSRWTPTAQLRRGVLDACRLWDLS